MCNLERKQRLPLLFYGTECKFELHELEEETALRGGITIWSPLTASGMTPTNHVANLCAWLRIIVVSENFAI